MFTQAVFLFIKGQTMPDKYIAKFSALNTFLAAYMHDVTHTICHDIKAMSKHPKFIGRAYTVKGPDIYLNALEENVPPNSVFIQAHTDLVHSLWDPFFNDMYAHPRGIVAVVIDGGISCGEALAQADDILLKMIKTGFYSPVRGIADIA